MASTIRLRSIEDLQNAYEELYNRQRDNKIDAKAVDGMNTTLKGATYLAAGLRMKLVDIYLKAQIKKLEIPPVMLPEGMRPKA